MVLGHHGRHRLEEAIGLLRSEDRRRLVEDQDPCPAEELLEDLHPLLFAHRQLPDRGGRVDAEAVLVREIADQRLDLTHRSGPPVLPQAEHDVLGCGEAVHQPEVLIHHPDPVQRRVLRRPEGHLLAVEHDAAAVRPVEARQHRTERRLAGAVLAEQTVDLARAEVEVDRVDGGDAIERLGQTSDLQPGRTRFHRQPRSSTYSDGTSPITPSIR